MKRIELYLHEDDADAVYAMIQCIYGISDYDIPPTLAGTSRAESDSWETLFHSKSTE